MIATDTPAMPLGTSAILGAIDVVFRECGR
jgi:hypothetical protein